MWELHERCLRRWGRRDMGGAGVGRVARVWEALGSGLRVRYNASGLQGRSRRRRSRRRGSPLLLVRDESRPRHPSALHLRHLAPHLLRHQAPSSSTSLLAPTRATPARRPSSSTSRPKLRALTRHPLSPSHLSTFILDPPSSLPPLALPRPLLRLRPSAPSSFSHLRLVPSAPSRRDRISSPLTWGARAT